MEKHRSKVFRYAVALLIPLALVLVFVPFEIFGGNTDTDIPVTETESLPETDLGFDMLEVHFLDVGQGDSILIRTKNGLDIYNMLIDTGEQQYAETLTEYLQSLGIRNINVLVNTHPHADHMGGMADIISKFGIGEMYMPKLPDDMIPATRVYENLLDAMFLKNIQANPLHEGVYIDMPGEAKIEVYWPRQGMEDFDDLNNVSAILKLTYGDTSFLFTGDAEKSEEKAVLENGADLSATVLDCGHHGSKTSTSQEFLEMVNPQAAVISCGKDNKYGHPHDETLEALAGIGSEVYRTDLNGTVIMQSNGSQVTVKLEKG